MTAAKKGTHKPVEPAALGLELAKDVVVGTLLQAPSGACKDQVGRDANGHSPVAESFIQSALVQFLGDPEKKVVGVEKGLDALGQGRSTDDGRHLGLFVVVVAVFYMLDGRKENKSQSVFVLRARTWGRCNQ